MQNILFPFFFFLFILKETKKKKKNKNKINFLSFYTHLLSRSKNEENILFTYITLYCMNSFFLFFAY